MGLENDIRVLGRVELFRNLSNDQLRLLAFGAETVKTPAGRDIYRPDTPADGALIIVEGEISLYKIQDDKRVEIGKVEKGAILGELALISPTRHPTGATAATDCELLRLNRKLFRRMLEEYPETALALHRRISENLKAMLDRITPLGQAFDD